MGMRGGGLRREISGSSHERIAMGSILAAGVLAAEVRDRSVGKTPDVEVLPHHVPPQGGVTASDCRNSWSYRMQAVAG